MKKKIGSRKFGNIGRCSYVLKKESINEYTIIGKFCSIADNVNVVLENDAFSWLTLNPAIHNLVMDELYTSQLDNKFTAFNSKKYCEIGNDVWIGVNVVVLQGIKIGDGAIIGPNTVVTHDVPPYAIVAGAPARVVRYRFKQEIINDLLQIRWWDKPLSVLKELSFDNPIRDINFLKEYERKVENNIRVWFIVTSVVYPGEDALNYSNIRSEYTFEERLIQTQKTIQSVRERCPGAKILLVDGGCKNPESLKNEVDQYIYIGDVPLIKKAVNSKYKGLGEAYMLLEAIRNVEIADYYFKLSGRYFLNDNFKLTNFEFSAFNFRNYTKRNISIAKTEYVKGSHSTRLYGIPGEKLSQYEKSLKKSLKELRIGMGIEYVMPKYLKKEKIYYLDKLGVAGYCGVDKTYIDE